MVRDEVVGIIQAHQVELRNLGVKSLALFGSVARGQANADSDVDLLVELANPMGLFGFIQIKLFLEDLLDCPVDLGMLDSLNPALHEDVLRDRVNVL